MKILMLTENDPAGMAIAFRNAINKYTDHSCRLVTTESRYGFNYEKDIHLPTLKAGQQDEIEQLLKDADIIHFHILFDENRTLGDIAVKDFIKGKELVHHHHGHPDFRADPIKYEEKYRKLGRKVFVSTPDLLKPAPYANWIPNLVPIHSENFLPASTSNNDVIKLCQAPTRKELKNTDEFIRTAKSLKQKYETIEYYIIENTIYSECLAKKRECDIHFDHMQGYYGVSSLESLSQARPVIAGLDDFNIGHIKAFTEAETLPWIIARDSEALEKQIEMLICDSGQRDHKGHESRQFMETCWNEKNVLKTLFDMYEVKMCA